MQWDYVLLLSVHSGNGLSLFLCDWFTSNSKTLARDFTKTHFRSSDFLSAVCEFWPNSLCRKDAKRIQSYSYLATTFSPLCDIGAWYSLIHHCHLSTTHSRTLFTHFVLCLKPLSEWHMLVAWLLSKGCLVTSYLFLMLVSCQQASTTGSSSSGSSRNSKWSFVLICRLKWNCWENVIEGRTLPCPSPSLCLLFLVPSPYWHVSSTVWCLVTNQWHKPCPCISFNRQLTLFPFNVHDKTAWLQHLNKKLSVWKGRGDL